MSYENKILQMKKMLGKKTEKREEKPAFQKPDAPSYTAAWERAGLERLDNDFGVLFLREVRYPLDYQHGDYKLGELFTAIKRWSEVDEPHPYALDVDETLLFFDTETTGLKGAGTHIFLLGLLEVLDDAFVLTQYVLADPSNETALLFESKFWQREATIISYNGKSFDWPQLEVRWTLNQQHIPKLKEQRQVDLLHSSKRLWKDDLERMKLTQVEEEKLGFYRKGDIPGHLAPIIYFDAVKSGNAETLMKVLKHNEWDLLSLVTLYVHSTNLLLNDAVIESAVTHTNIGKWYGDIKNRPSSRRVLEQVTAHYAEDETALAHFYLAQQLKRDGEYEVAIEAFHKSVLLLAPKKQLVAYEQLAILYEHKLRDDGMALTMAKRGKACVQHCFFAKPEHKQRQLESWSKRVARLEKRLLLNG
ncbi:MAG: ribonuclease H-like domain-containing protein [Solibacillus sp.]